MRRHPGPRDSSLLPRLRVIQNGIRRERALTGQPSARQRLPVTPALLRQMRPPAPTEPGNRRRCPGRPRPFAFRLFFRAGEITVPRHSTPRRTSHGAMSRSPTRAEHCGCFSSGPRRINTDGGRRCSSGPQETISAP